MRLKIRIISSTVCNAQTHGSIFLLEILLLQTNLLLLISQRLLLLDMFYLSYFVMLNLKGERANIMLQLEGLLKPHKYDGRKNYVSARGNKLCSRDMCQGKLQSNLPILPILRLAKPCVLGGF